MDLPSIIQGECRVHRHNSASQRSDPQLPLSLRRHCLSVKPEQMRDDPPSVSGSSRNEHRKRTPPPSRTARKPNPPPSFPASAGSVRRAHRQHTIQPTTTHSQTPRICSTTIILPHAPTNQPPNQRNPTPQPLAPDPRPTTHQASADRAGTSIGSEHHNPSRTARKPYPPLSFPASAGSIR